MYDWSGALARERSGRLQQTQCDSSTMVKRKQLGQACKASLAQLEHALRKRMVMGSSPIGGCCTVSHALAADAQSKHTTAWACPCTVRLVAAPGQRHLPTCCHACFQKKLGHTPQKSRSTTSHFVFARWAQFQEGKWVQTRKIDALNMYRATSPKCTHMGKHRQEVSHVSHSQACLSMVVFDMNFKGLRPCEAVKRMKLEAMLRICTSHWHYVATFLILEALMAAKRPAILEMTNFFVYFADPCGPDSNLQPRHFLMC